MTSHAGELHIGTKISSIEDVDRYVLLKNLYKQKVLPEVPTLIL